jgi:hypothetical protein
MRLPLLLLPLLLLPLLPLQLLLMLMHVSHVRLTGSISYTLLNTTVSTLRLNMGLAPDPTVTVDLPPNIHPSLLAVTNGMKDSVNEVSRHRQIMGNSRLSPQAGQLCKVMAGQLGPRYSCTTLVSTGETNSGPPKQPHSNRPPTTVLQYKAQTHASWRAPHARLRIRTLINCAVAALKQQAHAMIYQGLILLGYLLRHYLSPHLRRYSTAKRKHAKGPKQTHIPRCIRANLCWLQQTRIMLMHCKMVAQSHQAHCHKLAATRKSHWYLAKQ